MNNAAKIGLMVAGGLGISAVGWMAVRSGIRKEVERVLASEYDWDNLQKKNWLTSRFSTALDLPSSKELAESVVPTWSLVMPEAAINDILEYGRQSDYWPAKRRGSRLPAEVDDMIFSVLRGMRDYYAAHDAALEKAK